MRYKPYGKTGHSVSAVGFGGMRFDLARGDDYNSGLLQYAFDKGINYFDTAPQYCRDRSEELFGIALSRMKSRRQQFYVSTKGAPSDCRTAALAIKAVKHSLSRLKCDYIDFYHVWCICRMGEYQSALSPSGQYEGLLKCKEQGLIRHIVVSSHLRGPEIAQLISKKEFEGILLGVNILNFQYRWQGVEAAYNAGMGVVAMNPLAGGVIPTHESRLAFLASEGLTPTESAIRFCVSCPQLSSAIFGVTTREHIDMACRIAEKARPYSAEELTLIRRQISKNMNRLCTGCGYCMDRCPKNINIAGLMQVYNEFLLAGKTDAEMAKEYENQKKWGILSPTDPTAAECVQCGRCELACTQHLDIIRRLEKITEWEKVKP